MKTVGFVGLGHLGLPCALTMSRFSDYAVIGYDVSEQPREILEGSVEPPNEVGIEMLLQDHRVMMVPTVKDLVAEVDDVVFVAVQTPHDAAYGGERPMPEESRDFEYSYLTAACRSVAQAAMFHRKKVTMVVISTVLPGTMNKVIRPLLNEFVTLVYSPLFIAMGTVMDDYLDPEFVIMGADREGDVEPVEDVYASMHSSQCIVTGVESAELVKVAYNSFISLKIVYANTLMEICDKTGADCDDVTRALQHATDRVISTKYLQGGMGDGGQCHPRDAIAMAHLAKKLDLSYDLLGGLVQAREAQSAYLAEKTAQWHKRTGKDVTILGTAYKPGVDLTHGSPALLLKNQLTTMGIPVRTVDPVVNDGDKMPTEPGLYVLGCAHDIVKHWTPPQGSVVIDPFGITADTDGCLVLRVGRKK